MANPSALTDLRSSFGAYYRQEGQGMKDLDKQFLLPSVTDNIFNLRPTQNTQERKVRVNITDPVFQKFQAQVSASGQFSLEPESISMQDAKYEIKLDNLDALEESYMGFLADNDGNDRSKWPFVQFLANEMAIAKGRQDFELYEAYKGVFTSIAVAGTANAAGANFNGIKKSLKAYATAGSSNVVALGTVETDPEMFYKQVNEWVATCKADAVSRMIIENMCDFICMAPELAQRYAEGKDIVMNGMYSRSADANPDSPVTTVRVPYSTKLAVVGLPSMTSETGIFMTMKENRAAYIKRPRGEQEAGIWMDGPYTPYLFFKFWKGLGFWYPGYVWTNQTATNPS